MEPEPAAVSAEPAPEKHVVLALENVSKRFCRDLKRSLFYGVQDIAREVVGQSPHPDRLRKDEFWAVQNIDIELRSGEALGIVGINGCGKTTLMRIIAGLIKPTTGRLTLRGRLAPLLALGAGFNPVLTGRENVFANMSILGLTYDEIKDRFDDVVKFSEIGYAIDAPVQTYSSGMVARLGFACAINTQPDILLLDEVLAVGDMNFRRKCLERLFQMRASGMSLIMVHHSPTILLSIAEKALYLRRGQKVGYGPISTIVQQYERDLVKDVQGESVQDDWEKNVVTPDMHLDELSIESADGDAAIMSGRDAVIRARFRVEKPIERMNFSVTIYRMPSTSNTKVSMRPQPALKMVSRRDGGSVSDVQIGKYELCLELPALGLRDGIYQVGLRVSAPPKFVLGTLRTISFPVTSDDITGSEYRQVRTWHISTQDGRPLRTEKVTQVEEDFEDLIGLEESR